jgi:hypothetical protein
MIETAWGVWRGFLSVSVTLRNDYPTVPVPRDLRPSPSPDRHVGAKGLNLSQIHEGLAQMPIRLLGSI